MGIRERKKREFEDLRQKIMIAAAEILAEDGYKGFSVRKIAARIEYSPAIIYHYFKDKSEIVSRIVAEGYGRILERLRDTRFFPEDPIKTLLGAAKSYSNLVLENPNLFHAVLLNDIGKASAQVRMLEGGISKSRESVAILSGMIGRFIKSGQFRPVDAELTALVIWSALHGLLTRFILEPGVSPARREKLLRHLIEVLVMGLRK
jgi:AcrR family transcriptional regulator